MPVSPTLANVPRKTSRLCILTDAGVCNERPFMHILNVWIEFDCLTYKRMIYYNEFLQTEAFKCSSGTERFCESHFMAVGNGEDARACAQEMHTFCTKRSWAINFYVLCIVYVKLNFIVWKLLKFKEYWVRPNCYKLTIFLFSLLLAF